MLDDLHTCKKRRRNAAKNEKEEEKKVTSTFFMVFFSYHQEQKSEPNEVRLEKGFFQCSRLIDQMELFEM